MMRRTDKRLIVAMGALIAFTVCVIAGQSTVAFGTALGFAALDRRYR